MIKKVRGNDIASPKCQGSVNEEAQYATAECGT